MADVAKRVSFYIVVELLLQNAYGFNVHNLNFGDKYHCLRHHEKQLEIYCYSPQARNIVQMWRTVSVSVSIPPDRYEFYVGASPTDVYNQYEAHRSTWNINFFSWKSQKINLHPFNGSCLGVYTDEEYHAQFNVIWVDFWKVSMLIGGVALFFLAPKLSHNAFFYYLCGVTLGVCASFLFILYLFSKVLPRKPAMAVFLVGGWTVSIYLLQLVWSNMQLLLLEYTSYITTYTCVTALVSFIICYRFGPVTDPRSKNLIKWALQVSSMGLIFFSSEFQDATIAIIIVLLAMYNFPSSWAYHLTASWRKAFPPRVKLLTETEFVEEGLKETKKALTELKQHCSSPDCNAWKTVLRLKDPMRFASFVEGNSHVSDEEIMSYDSDSQNVATELLTEESDSE